MNDGNKKVLQKIFNITDAELDSLLVGKDQQSQFILYMAALDHSDSSMYMFKQLGYNLHTTTRNIRGYTSPFQVLLENNVFDRDKKQLFHFLVNTLCRHILDKNIKLL